MTVLAEKTKIAKPIAAKRAVVAARPNRSSNISRNRLMPKSMRDSCPALAFRARLVAFAP